MAHHEADLAHDVQRGGQQQVQGACDYALGAVFHGHHAKLRRTGRGGMEDFVKAIARNVRNAGAKKTQRGLFAEGACGAQVGHALWRFERAAGGHDFTPDKGHALWLERAVVAGLGVGVLQIANDLRFALGAKHDRAFGLFQLTYLVGQSRTAVEQGQELQVQGIDLYTQFRQCFAHQSFLFHGSAVGALKGLHVIHQRLHTRLWHGVVQACSHAAHRFVALELQQARAGRT